MKFYKLIAPMLEVGTALAQADASLMGNDIDYNAPAVTVSMRFRQRQTFSFSLFETSASTSASTRTTSRSRSSTSTRTSTASTTRRSSTASSTSSSKTTLFSATSTAMPTRIPTATPPTTTPPSQTPSPPSTPAQQGLSGGAKAGIAVGVVAGVGILAFAIFYMVLRARRSRKAKHTSVFYGSTHAHSYAASGHEALSPPPGGPAGGDVRMASGSGMQMTPAVHGAGGSWPAPMAGGEITGGGGVRGPGGVISGPAGGRTSWGGQPWGGGWRAAANTSGETVVEEPGGYGHPSSLNRSAHGGGGTSSGLGHSRTGSGVPLLAPIVDPKHRRPVSGSFVPVPPPGHGGASQRGELSG